MFQLSVGKPNQTQNQYFGRTLRPNVKRSPLTLLPGGIHFFSDQPNSLILKWNEFSGTTLERLEPVRPVCRCIRIWPEPHSQQPAWRYFLYTVATRTVDAA